MPALRDDPADLDGNHRHRDSLKIFDHAFKGVKTFQPLKPEQIAALLKKTAQAAENGRFEPFTTTSGFDSTAKHPEWLG
ncbi:MAG TPA: hypothetical protein VGP63_30915 [Planctomycetaceae bacterium]|jgi:hypothetical protein|nr:hypothetical protein [Planctomycetaceae bacterium]